MVKYAIEANHSIKHDMDKFKKNTTAKSNMALSLINLIQNQTFAMCIL